MEPIRRGTVMLPLDRIHPNPDNPRKEAGDVTALAASIRKHGLVTPLVVRPSTIGGPGHFVLEAGERRWTAIRASGIAEVECRILDLGPDEVKAKTDVIFGFVENMQRRDLGAMDRARGYGRLKNEFGMTMKQIGDEVGLSESAVSSDLMLLELDAKSQARVERGEIRLERARQAIIETRKKNRKKAGHKPVGPFWEPDYFTKNHPLSRAATRICDAREHTSRRRRGGSCDQCWETAIRQDQQKVDAQSVANGQAVFKSPEQSLFLDALAQSRNQP